MKLDDAVMCLCRFPWTVLEGYSGAFDADPRTIEGGLVQITRTP